MASKKYQLRILPLFEDDLNQIVDYISFELNNPAAANELVNEIEIAVYKRLDYAESFEIFHSAKQRQYPYYQIRVKNYTIFYVVTDNVMELRRILYRSRNWKKLI